MMRYAIFSDIHANLEAFQAVLDDIGRQDADALVCLGDITGYSSNPNECVALAREHNVQAIAGNHDLMVAGRQGFEHCTSNVAREVVLWTRTVISNDALAYLTGLPLTGFIAEKALMFHSSLFSTDQYINSARAAAQSFGVMRERHKQVRIGFFGHTHLEAAYSMDDSSRIRKMPVASFRIEPGFSYLINPGSIGESRDTDPRASYVIFDDATCDVSFRKVEYDIESARAKNERNGFGTLLVRPKRSPMEKAYIRLSRVAYHILKLLRETGS
ncbi:MAG: metallophosphoesterase family protein [Nitrospirae bacterium]|nr:metallophosphoesterase family protein [Nitrospirota bacterium]